MSLATLALRARTHRDCGIDQVAPKGAEPSENSILVIDSLPMRATMSPAEGRSRRAEERDRFARPDAQRNVVHGKHMGVAGGEARDCEAILQGRPSGPRRVGAGCGPLTEHWMQATGRSLSRGLTRKGQTPPG